MRNFIALVLTLAVLVFAVPPSDTLSTNAGGMPGPAGVWKPAKYSSKTPVTIWFHGGMASRRCDKGLEAGNGYFEIAQNHIVVSPSACLSKHWWESGVLLGVDSFLDTLENRLNRKIQTVNLVGVSDGCLGVMAYTLGGRRNVNRRMLVSGNLASVIPDPLALSQNVRIATGSWLFLQGGSDALYPSEYVYPWIDRFCAVGSIKCTKHFDPAGEHDWSYWVKNRIDWIKESVEK